MSMVEPKFRFKQMELKMRLGNALEFHQTMFSITPETFDAIDVVTFSIRKLVIPMVDTKVFFITKIDQPIISAPAITVNHSIDIGMTSDNSL